MEHLVKEKYAQMIRVYRHLAQISINNGRKISNVEAKDTAEDFFNQCYHLKDYFKKDKTIKIFDDVEKYINKDPNLSLAADYCNIFKHAGLNNKPRSGKKIEKINTHIFLLHPTSQGKVNFSRLEIKIDGKSHDVFAIATECVKAWNKYLKKHGLQKIIEEV